MSPLIIYLFGIPQKERISSPIARARQRPLICHHKSIHLRVQCASLSLSGGRPCLQAALLPRGVGRETYQRLTSRVVFGSLEADFSPITICLGFVYFFSSGGFPSEDRLRWKAHLFIYVRYGMVVAASVWQQCRFPHVRSCILGNFVFFPRFSTE